MSWKTRIMELNEFNYFYTSKFNFGIYKKLLTVKNCYAFFLWQLEYKICKSELPNLCKVLSCLMENWFVSRQVGFSL